ncbi:MAG: cation diffusion facilitator family transporter, partial [Burkholderiales bacterium]
GFNLIRRSVHGLMDTALPAEERAIIDRILDSYRSEGMAYHALRTRRAASRRFVSAHILVPGAWSVQRGHDLMERIEAEIRDALSNTTITTHMEPIEDPVSWRDAQLEPVGMRNSPAAATHTLGDDSQ